MDGQLAQKKLLLVFVHGFASNDATFEGFPEHIRTVLSTSLFCQVEALLYPTYSTTGNFSNAVDDFCAWLLEATEKQLEGDENTPHRDCWTIIMGHSMGGLLAADAVIKLQAASLQRHKVMGLVAFDSPFYGVDHRVISQTARSKASAITDTCTEGVSLLTAAASVLGPVVSRSSSVTTIATRTGSAAAARWAWGAAGLAAVSLIGGAYAGREHLSKGWQFMAGHLEFASALIKQGELRNRVETIRATTDLDFRCFYNEVRWKNPATGILENRTFIEQPPSATEIYWTKVAMDSEDEIEAHMNMFSPTLRLDPLRSRSSISNAGSKPNTAYYSLVQQTLLAIKGMVAKVDETLVRGWTDGGDSAI